MSLDKGIVLAERAAVLWASFWEFARKHTLGMALLWVFTLAGYVLRFSYYDTVDIGAPQSSFVLLLMRSLRVAVYFALIGFCVLLSYFLFFVSPNVVWRAVVFAVAFAHFASCLVDGLLHALYGFGISSYVLLLLHDTNPDEAWGFVRFLPNQLGALLSFWEILLFPLLAVSLCLMFRMLSRKVWLFVFAAGGLAMLFMVAVTLKRGGAFSQLFPMVRIPPSVSAYVAYQNNMVRLMSGVSDSRLLENASSVYYADKVVVLIGESVSRGYCSKYGFYLPTTPTVDAMGEDSLVAFTNVTAFECLTRPTMEKFLTFCSDGDNETSWFDYPNVVDLFRRVGYRVVWVDCQAANVDNIDASYAISSKCDTVVRLRDLYADGFFDDAAFLPYMRRFVSECPRLLFFAHLNGSHLPYGKRFPKTFARFGADDIRPTELQRSFFDERHKQVVADYANSLLYADTLVYQTVTELAADTAKSVMLFFSDHGQNVYDTRDYVGHDNSCPTAHEVPMFVYLNPAMRNRHQDFVAKLKENAATPVSNSDLINGLLTLTGTKCDFYDPKKDFAVKCGE